MRSPTLSLPRQRLGTGEVNPVGTTVGKPDRAARRELFNPAATFDDHWRDVTRIDADLGTLSADAHMHMEATVMDREAQRAK